MHVCLTALNAYPAVDPLATGPIGGIETRAWLLARGLAARPDTRVQLVVRQPTAPRLQQAEGVELVPLIDPMYPLWQSLGTCLERTPRFPGVRLKRWDWRLVAWAPRLALDRLLRGRVYDSTRPDPRLVDLRPDLFGTFGVQTHSAVVIHSARAAGRPVVLCLGSDGDLDPLFESEGHDRDPYGTPARVGRFILQSADLILAQTPEQQQRLLERFGRRSEVLLNPIDAVAWDAATQQPLAADVAAGPTRYVLWVGRAEELHKRPQLCLEVARRSPDVPFLMILNPREADVEARIRRDAPANVRIVDRVPFPQMPAVFHRAALLLSTSHLEGFPNVFLQAALSGVPIASLEVGEEFLQASGAGRTFGGDLAGLAAHVADVWSGRSPYSAAGPRAYVLAHHGLPAQSERLAGLLGELASAHSAAR